MRHRLRSHLTFANVVSVIALFVALGGTAAAAVIITDNSQVAQNTISGHKPPTGKHANVIAASINGQDVADNSLGGADINELGLTGDTRKLIFNSDIGTSTPTKIGTVGPYTIKATCENVTPAHDVFSLYANGPSGTARIAFTDYTSDGEQTVPVSDARGIPANQDAPILSFSAETSYQVLPDGDFHRDAGTAMIRSGSVLVQIDFNVVVDSRDSTAPHHCFLLGTATRAT
jgi:hypothetical protein